MPAVLAELAFVDNKSDADKIATPAQKTKCGSYLSRYFRLL